jgi:Luciferase-like monooxygenase
MYAFALFRLLPQKSLPFHRSITADAEKCLPEAANAYPDSFDGRQILRDVPWKAPPPAFAPDDDLTYIKRPNGNRDLLIRGPHAGRPHRQDDQPDVALAAGASRTKRIRLTSAVSVLSSDDPVRVCHDFATLDLLSGVRENEKVTWSGKFRPPLQGLGVYPRSRQQPLPV